MLPLSFLLRFLLAVLFGSLIICGFFASTRGYWECYQGGRRLRGNIGKWWWAFWFRTREGVIHVEELCMEDRSPIIDKLIRDNSLNMFHVERWNSEGVYASPRIIPCIEILEPLLGDDISIGYAEVPHDKVRLSLYRRVPVYVFPEWLRDMMAGCVTCHASFYGSIVFWAAIALMSRASLESVFGFANNIWLAVCVSWFAYVLSLAYANTLLWGLKETLSKSH